ncbi:MAG: acetyl-CoA carboxylase biotin carboxyl carrier protein [Burkholderiaceae bacterium]|nr:acetyl-CoA carboxylase biotin carboxyl carrier protein [Burkholderiaceae bacterium]
MDLRKLKTLIDLVAESGIAELEITEGEDKVRIVKSSATPQASHVSHVYAAAPAAAAAAAIPAASDAAPATAAPAAEPEGKIIKSPMVGTFYRASAPGADPFVSVGTSVSEGQTMCVIEAMKLMNEIPADCAGVVKQILVENGEPVEFGQPLFVLA